MHMALVRPNSVSLARLVAAACSGLLALAFSSLAQQPTQPDANQQPTAPVAIAPQSLLAPPQVAMPEIAGGISEAELKQLLVGKPEEVWHVSPQETVLRALEILSEKGVGALLVMDGQALVGIISERDYARKVALRGKSSLETRVADIMVEDVLYVTPEHTSDECMALMSDRRIRHLPVVELGRVVGMLSIGDLVKNLLEEQKDTIEHLEQYIRGA